MEAKKGKNSRRKHPKNNDYRLEIPNQEEVLPEEPKHHNLTSLESFSKSSESLKMPISRLESRKKVRSTSRPFDSKYEGTVSKDVGESYMTNIMKDVSPESPGSSLGMDEKLRLHNIKLESKINRLELENMEILKERNDFKTRGEELQQEVCNKDSLCKDIENNVSLITKKHNDKIQELSEAEYKLNSLLQDINEKSRLHEQQNAELHNLRDTLDNMKKNNVQLSLENQEKSSVVEDLKKKISGIHSQLELTKIYRENSEYQVEHLKGEIDRLNESRTMISEQLKMVEMAREKLQEEVIKLSSSLMEITNEKEQLIQNDGEMKLKIKRLNEQKLQQFTALLKQLEESQKEVLWLNEDKETLMNKLSLIQDSISDKSVTLEEERQKNAQLETKIRDLSEEIVEIRDELSRKEDCFNQQEEYLNTLRSQLKSSEADLAGNSELLKQFEAEKQDMENRIEYLTGNLTDKDESLSKLNENLYELQSAYERVTIERNDALKGIENMREEIDKVETSFEVTRQNLCMKEQALKLMEDLTENLRGEIERERENYFEKEQLMMKITKEKENMQEEYQNLQDTYKGIQGEVDELRNSLSVANHKILELEEVIEQLTNDKTNLQSQNEHSHEELMAMKQELQNMKEQLKENSDYQQKYANLMNSFELVKNDYFELSGQHELLNNEFQQTTQELNSQLNTTKEELAKLITQKEEIVHTNQRSLEMAESKSNQLNNELESVKFNYTVELANKEEQFRVELEKSRKDFSDMCQEKIRCESAINNLQQHIKALNDEYKEKLSRCNSKMLTLQQQSSEYAEYERKSRSLQEELAKRKGEFEAIMESWQQFKTHVKQIEGDLSMKHAEMLDLTAQHDREIQAKDESMQAVEKENNRLQLLIKDHETRQLNLEQKLQDREAILEKLDKKFKYLQKNHETAEKASRAMEEKFVFLTEENVALKKSEEELVANLQKRHEENLKLQQINGNLLDKLSKKQNTKTLEDVSLKNLLDEVEQRKRMLDQTELQGKLREETYSKEMQQMKKFIQEIRDDRDAISRQFELKSQQDIVACAVLARIRTQLSGIVSRYDLDSSAAGNVTEKDSGICRMPKELIENLRKALLDTDDINLSSRKPTKLLNCIDDLRSQIDQLQSEIAMEMEE